LVEYNTLFLRLGTSSVVEWFIPEERQRSRVRGNVIPKNYATATLAYGNAKVFFFFNTEVFL